MTYSQDKQIAVLAAFKTDLDKIKKDIEKTNKEVEKLNSMARDIWKRSYNLIRDRLQHFERRYRFFMAYPPEEFEKNEGELSLAWGKLKNAYNEGLNHIANQPTEEEKKKRKEEHHSLLDL